MRIVLFAPYSILTPHYETDLEIGQYHLDKGDDVLMLGCSSSLLSCDVNLDHDVSVCLACTGKRRQGISRLSRRIGVKTLHSFSRSCSRELGTIRTRFGDPVDLQKYTIGNFDIGYGVLSSVISAFRDPEPDLGSPEMQLLVARLLVSSFAVYCSIKKLLRATPVDRMYVFNGRFAPLRAALRACQSLGVDCYAHDRGCDLNHYATYRNTTPHDLDYIDAEIRSAWSRAASYQDERERLGSAFFLERSKGIEQNWFTFVKRQQQGVLPANWDPARENIAVFTSSEDEFAAIGDSWKNPVYEDQNDGIKKILCSVPEENSHVYIRVHPNLSGVQNRQTREIATLSAQNLTVIPADSPVDSYALLRSASKAVTFGSTIGVEATFWGVPSILAGQCLYKQLGATYNPRSHAELCDMLRRDLPPKPRQCALMYGYYMKTYGRRFEYFQPTGVFGGLFRAKQLRPDKVSQGLIKLVKPLETAKPSLYVTRKVLLLWTQAMLGLGLSAVQ